ncbi:MAG: M56 family metallopeptidase [Lachnospiraceae bacterium]|nr:M56 family metallopeptidase [Lachnospiraceae bacterium]
MIEFVFHILKMNVIAAVLICLVILIARLTKEKYSLKWKYYMWLVISLFLLVPVNLSEKSPIRLQIERPETLRGTVRRDGAEGQERLTEASLLQTGAQAAAASPASQAGNGGLPAENGAAGNSGASMDKNTYLPVHISGERISIYGFLQLFSIIWLAGIFVCGGTKILRYHFSLHKMRRWSYPVEDPSTEELYRWICLKKHIRRPPRLLISPVLSTPVLAGLCDTALYLTEEEYDPEELRFILSHELTHYKRRDLWYKMLLLAVSTVYWFNPTLYWMCSEAEKDIENLCDGRVVENYTRSEQMKYGRLLLKTAALQNHVPYLAASLNDSTLVFKDRITYMSNLNHLKKNVFLVLALTAIMMGAQLLVGSAVKETEGKTTASFPVSAGDRAGNGDAVPEIAASAKNDGLQNKAAEGMAAGQKQEVPGGQAALQENRNRTAGGLDDLAGNTGEESAGAENTGIQTDETVSRVNVSTERADFTAWVTSQQLNVRSGSSESASILGTVYYADAVEVIGIEKENGVETGWYQINYNGTVAYVSASYVSAVPNTAETLGNTLADEQVTLYSADGSSADYVYRAADGNWYDGSGRQFLPNGAGQWTCVSSGIVWTETAPSSPADQAVNQVQVIDGEGLNRQTLYADADGSWRNGAGGAYTDNGDGTWTGPGGTVWYRENQ